MLHILGTNIKIRIGNLVKEIDWTLLFFLIFVLNVKLAVKVIAVVIIYLLRFNFTSLLRLKGSRLPAFYFLVIGLACLHLINFKTYTNPGYIPVFLTGITFWMLCFLTAHQLMLSVERKPVEIIHRTLLAFFLINAAVSAGNFLAIILETGSINPYGYQGDFQKYFINTGDYIKGISWDTSTTNAVINAYGVIYFLTRKNTFMILVCMSVLLLTGSNIVNILLLVTLLYVFILRSDTNQKSLVVVCIMLLVIFMAKVSPQNNRYIKETYEKLIRNSLKKQEPDSSLNIRLTDIADSMLIEEERKQKIARLYIDSARLLSESKKTVIQIAGNVTLNEAGKPFIPEPDIHSMPFQSRNDTSVTRKKLLQFIGNKQLENVNTIYEKRELPGKITAVIQTLLFLRQNPQKILLGEGPGNFSSKLAFRATGLNIAGGYPLQYIYIHPDFLSNQLKLYLHFFSKPAKQHSLINSPNSVYTQLIAEYGLLGLLLFVLFYFRFFIRHYRTLTYGLPLLLMLTGVLFIDYWFEQLSVIILFELMLFLNIKETSIPDTHS